MLRKINELDQSLGTLLAVIPHNDRGGEALTWIDGHDPNNRHPAFVVTNTDIEEEFHMIFGPYVLDGYEAEMEEMLADSIALKKGRRSFICSTLKLDFYSTDNISFIINRIFIRPCLQRHKILGRIILFFARNLPWGCCLVIGNCQSVLSKAIDNHYGGTDSSIFRRRIWSDDGPVTYELRNRGALIQRLAFLDGMPYPRIAELNGKSHLSELDVRWANLAKLQQDYWFHNGIEMIARQFTFGYNDLNFNDFVNLCCDLQEEIEETLYYIRRDNRRDNYDEDNYDEDNYDEYNFNEQMRLEYAMKTLNLLINEGDLPIAMITAIGILRLQLPPQRLKDSSIGCLVPTDVLVPTC